MSGNADLLWILAVHLALTGLPGVAAALFAARRGVTGVPVVLGIALAVSGVLAFASFWAYFASSTVGQTWDFLVMLGSVQVIVMSVYRGGLDRELLRALRTPLLLWVLGSFFVVFLGFLHGGTEQALGMSASRFSGPLPPDNDIPRFFAEWFANEGHRGTPPLYLGEWHMSDRPPLQVGYVLGQRAFLDDTQNLHYEVLCVVVQQLWIVGMWAVLVAAGLRARTRGLAMFAAMVSDVAILHGFFVWPKLIAAAFLLAALALVISPQWSRLRTDPRGAGLLAALLALAMLSHGSSIYGAIPLLLIALVRGGLPSWRWLGVGAAVGVVLMGSWSAYQRYDDPPGNRLLKWHLGGQIEIDDRGTMETIVDNYEAAGFDGTVENKWNNVEEIVGIYRADAEVGGAIDAFEAGDTEEGLAFIRAYRFFSLVPFLGLFLIAPLAMIAGRRRGRENEAEWRFALLSLAFVTIGCVFWGLLQWGLPGHSSAMIHAGTLAIPLLAICGCVAGLRATFPRLAVAVVAVNSLLVLVMYAPSLTPLEGTGYSVIAALIAAASLIGIAALLFGPEPPATPRPERERASTALV